MGIRRRRKRLTSTISNIEQRLQSVELKPISLLTTAQINAVVSTAATVEQPNFYIDSSAPNVYIRVEDAYYYPKRLTGKENDYVEVYTQGAVRGISTGDRIEINGIHGTVDENIDVTSDNFKLLDKDESPWDSRESYEHDPTQDQDPGVVIGYSYSVVPESLAPTTWSTRRRLSTKSEVSSFSITGSTVTITTAADHKFKQNDVIFININSDAPNNQESLTAYGVDGIFRLNAVTSNTLEYSLSAGVDTPTGDITPTADVYVYPTIRNWSDIGDTWIDTSTDPDTTYYWTGLRWAEFTATTQGVGGSDSTAPDVVSNVAVVTESSGGYSDSSGDHRARITLEWDAPTQDSDGGSLTDLAGYEVWASYSAGGEWTKSGLLSTEREFTIEDLDPAVTVYFKIFAVDTSLNRSTAVDFDTVSGTFAGVLNPPSAPDLSSDLGVVTAKWDGLDNTGVNMHPSVRYIETHVSLQDNFTTSNDTIVASMAAGTDNYSSIYQYRDISGNLEDMAYGTDYYFKFVAVDSAGNKTEGSSQSIARISQVDGASIEAGAISAYILRGESIVATSNTSSHQIELNANFLRAVNKSTNTETFRMNTSNGSVTIGTGITNTKIDGNQITVANISASNITTGTLDANTISVTNLSASSITSGVLNADNITVTGTISGNVISGGTITGTTISGGSLLTTASGGKSVDVSQSTVDFLFNGAVTGSISSNSGLDEYSPKLEIIASGTSNNGFGTLIGDLGALFGNTVAVNGFAGPINVFMPENTGLAFSSVGSGRFAEGVQFDSSNNYSLAYSGSYNSLTAYGNFAFNNDVAFKGIARFQTIRRDQSNGQIVFETSAGTDVTYIDTSAASSSETQLWLLGRGSAVQWVNRSSRRYKTNINSYVDSEDRVLNLNVVTYQSDPQRVGDDGSPMPLGPVEVGLIAEEVAEAGLDLLVVYNSSDPTLTEGLDYTRIGVLLIPIVKKLKEEIAQLKDRIDNL